MQPDRRTIMSQSSTLRLSLSLSLSLSLWSKFCTAKCPCPSCHPTNSITALKEAITFSFLFNSLLTSSTVCTICCLQSVTLTLVVSRLRAAPTYPILRARINRFKDSFLPYCHLNSTVSSAIVCLHACVCVCVCVIHCSYPAFGCHTQ